MSQFAFLRAGTPPASDQELYDKVASATAAVVIRDYSSSFGLASRLLHEPVRGHVRNVYALVRLADEVVDGPVGLRRPQRARELLDRLERETVEAMDDGYSTNLVVHAFGSTARACGVDPGLVRSFFSSMRTDLTVHSHDADSFEQYVYGSAEVVGLICLQVFLASPSTTGVLDALQAQQQAHQQAQQRYDELAGGARSLGAAFQKVNFLRDLGADYEQRGRSYFPGIDPRHLSEADKDRLLDDIDADLAAAGVAVRGLPDNSRVAVAVAHAVFSQLAERLRRTPASTIMHRRVSLSSTTKARVALAAVLRDRRP